MTDYIDLRTLFTKEALAQRLQAMEPLHSSVMDTIFTDMVVWPLPILSREMIMETIKTLPLVRRGAPSVPMTSPGRQFEWYEPLPVHPNVDVTAKDLNDLRLLTPMSLEQWAAERTESLRKSVRATTEGIASTVLTGKISWPVQLAANSYETYEVDFGAPHEVAVDTKLTGTSKPSAAFEIIQAVEEEVNNSGYGGTYELWAGRALYSTLYQMVENSTSTAKLRVGVSDIGIDIGGYIIKRMSEKYQNPQTGTLVDKIGAKDLTFIAKDAGHRLFYCAVDDLDAKLQAMPFFIKPVKTEDPSGWKLIAQSKPFPVVNVLGIGKATMIA